MSLPPFQYLAPRSGEELAYMLATHGSKARIIAGGTDLINWMAERIVQPDYVIDLRGVRHLDGIAYEPGKGLWIGAGTKIRALEKSPILKEKYTSVSMAAGQIGSAQVRAMASIGGNIANASPCADMPPSLVTFGAAVTLVSARGRRELSLEEFIRGNRLTALEPDEFLESIQVPDPWTYSASRYAAIGLRAAQEIDIASVAVHLAIDRKSGTIANVRIAMGAVAPIPMRAEQAEQILAGQKPSDPLLARAAESCGLECQPIDDLRASASYRRHVIKVLAGRMLRETVNAIS